MPAVKGLSPSGKGRVSDPNCWITGPCLITRDKYYAYLKHRSQAKYRGESYELTWQDWLHIWPQHLWDSRGRRSHDLCLTRRDFDGEWSIVNTVVCTRREHFIIKKEYNAQQRLRSI